MTDPDASAPADTQPAPKPARAWYHHGLVVAHALILFFPVGLILMWAGRTYPVAVRVIVTIFFGLFILAGVSDDGEASSGSTEDAADLRIRPSITEFRAAMPLLARLPMKEVTRNGATEYLWFDVSMNKKPNPNSVVIYDVGSDGSLDWITLGLVMDTKIENSILEALLLLGRIVVIAGEPTEAIDEVTDWASQKESYGAHGRRRFGSVVVELGMTYASDPSRGGLLLVTIDGGVKPPD